MQKEYHSTGIPPPDLPTGFPKSCSLIIAPRLHFFYYPKLAAGQHNATGELSFILHYQRICKGFWLLSRSVLVFRFFCNLCTNAQLKCLICKIVLSVGAALCKSFFGPRLVLGFSSFVLFVFLLSLQCLCIALDMSQACPQVSTYSFCCLCQYLFQAVGFSKDLQRKSEWQYTFLNMSFLLIANIDRLLKVSA